MSSTDGSSVPSTAAYKAPNANSTLIVSKPTMSLDSKVRRKEPHKLQRTRPSTNASSSSRSKNGGKLARLMDMPMDIFLEVVALLHPRDLLNISRVSRHFRGILMSRTSKGMWAAARKNVQNPPVPPGVLSEPKYASVLFEHDCQACGISRAGKESFAMSLRLCSACWGRNVFTRYKMLQRCKEVKPIADILFSLVSSSKGGYYEAEFEAVAERYLSLSGTEQESFVEQRRTYVQTMKEHELAVFQWQNRVRNERNKEGTSAAIKRRRSIYAKLIDLGYTEDEFPDNHYDPEWESLVFQPRELTEQIWKRILPKLKDCMVEEAQRKSRARRQQRGFEVGNILLTFLEELLPTNGDFLPPYMEILKSDEVNEMIDEDDAQTPVTRERFDVVVPAVLRKLADKRRARFMEALYHALYPESLTTDAELQPTPDLDCVMALFPCLSCHDHLIKRNYTVSELNQHMKERHLRGMAKYVQSDGDFETARFQVDRVRQVLQMLGIAEDARYQDVSEKVVCLCGKPGFEQPAQFSALIHHIEEEYYWHSKSLKDNAVYNDHDFDKSPPFLKLLQEGETFTLPEVVVPEGFTFGSAICVFCKICGRDGPQFRNVKEFVWHVRAKHHEEPTEESYMPVSYLWML
ncbi:hypothetical protein BDY19DRAFT_327671 [Irpex rosettiformis]|uniref:Uncharacterized protein n=1 Tax=Irpex rosettiformis TaxID=378272 RepID=A0ACB8TXH6_9APHY|nr:hypothetical protein BDY19DRAFT_327671 [Irpex rosettiformis]